MTERDVVITGCAITSPNGKSLEQNICAWKEGVSNFSLQEVKLKYGQLVPLIGRCEQIDIQVLPDRKVQKAITRKDLIGLTTALKCAENSGIKKGNIDPERFGMYVGAGSTQIGDLEPYLSHLRSSMNNSKFDDEKFGCDLLGGVNPMVMLQTLMNNVLCYTSVALDIRGVNANFLDFQVAGLKAVEEGYHAISEGRADVVLVGGVSGGAVAFQADQAIGMGYLAMTTGINLEDSKRLVRPFDKNRCGTILSEGAAFLMLESRSHAVARNAPILAKIFATASAVDGRFCFTNLEPSNALIRCMKDILAGLNQKSMLVMAHANGSIRGDETELSGYETISRDLSMPLRLHSPKGVFGETSEASGVISLIMAMTALKDASLPPLWNYDSERSIESGVIIEKTRTPVTEKQAVVTARSFSGIATCVGIEV